jgi:hypothetical protein
MALRYIGSTPTPVTGTVRRARIISEPVSEYIRYEPVDEAPGTDRLLVLAEDVRSTAHSTAHPTRRVTDLPESVVSGRRVAYLSIPGVRNALRASNGAPRNTMGRTEMSLVIKTLATAATAAALVLGGAAAASADTASGTTVGVTAGSTEGNSGVGTGNVVQGTSGNVTQGAGNVVGDGDLVNRGDGDVLISLGGWHGGWHGDWHGFTHRHHHCGGEE